MSGLLAYLVGPGEENEHEHPHVIAGHKSVRGLGYFGDLSHAQALEIARKLDAPRRAFGTEVWVPNYLRDAEGRAVLGSDGRPLVNFFEPKRDGNVWHCSLSLHRDEGRLPDEKWAQIAGEFMDTVGFTTDGSGRADARWAAIHHGLSARGNDHIHIAASAVREDGTRVDTFNDYARAQEACRELEQRHGLRVVLGRHDGRVTRGYNRAQIYAAARAADLARGEAKAAMRTQTIEPSRDTLERVVRASLAASRSEAEFVATLRQQGLLLRRSRDRDSGEVRGWCVGMRPMRGRDGRRSHPVMPGGGTLAADLTLPRLRHNWDDTAQSRADAAPLWEEAEDALGRFLKGDESAIPEPSGTLPVPRTGAVVVPTTAEVNASIAELERWANKFSAIPVENTVAFAAAARQAAGILSAMSLAHETTPGLMAQAARTLSRYAQLPAHRDAPLPKWQLHDGVAGWTTMLLASRPDANPDLANLAVLHQLGRTIDAIANAAHQNGETARARELAAVVTRELDGIHRQLVPVDANTGEAQLLRVERVAQIAQIAFDTPSRAARPDPQRVDKSEPVAGTAAEQSGAERGPGQRRSRFDTFMLGRNRRSTTSAPRQRNPYRPPVTPDTNPGQEATRHIEPGHDRTDTPTVQPEVPRDRNTDTGRDR
ncbi:relaxase/mobilization nuclease domain-containing protein [Nocardia terpenica]|uniref:Relaxase/mobilization nuclease domain-containing protein n=1 Tax=Nocardia terpenica TaxID=455432 RepID=A0A6G9ZF86_9NOCA|nr:relaxase/mobilization nuclease domain-containing protein [Nocardia terpenica]QIS23653.1 relaxase/mobilization nuclease domain-containing protein [Nocardia terpenica]